MEPPGRVGDRTFAVAGGKGGSGKTTATLGVARALVERGRRPVVVDADVDLPDLHLRAGVDTEPGLHALAAGTAPTAVSQRSTALPGVDVIARGTGRPPVEGALRAVTALDRPVLLDCPAGAGPDAAAPLRAADASILAATDTEQSLEDARKTARMARALGAPPVGAVVRHTGIAAPDPRLAGAPVRVAPEVAEPPLRDAALQATYDRVAALLREGAPRP